MQTAQEIVTRQFYASMKNAKEMFDSNFSANSYLPRATRDLSVAMQQASLGMKALPGGKQAIAALPTSEMVSATRFQSAIKAAIKSDLDNALRQQMQGRLLPAAGETSYRSPEQISQQKFRAAMEKAAAIDAENAANAAARQAREQSRAVITNLRSQMKQGLLPGAGGTAGEAMRQIGRAHV